MGKIIQIERKLISHLSFLLLATASFAEGSSTAIVIPSQTLTQYGYKQNKLTGICTASMGANEIEIWHSSLAPGDHTPRHKHNGEEVFVFLKGEGKVNINDEDVYFKSPCTVIIPADIDHEVFNLGEEPTDHYTILRIGSTIWDANGTIMNLPWRN